MARTPRRTSISNEQIEQLKRNISILHVCADHGIELKRHGTSDYVGKCPFHEDEEPSFVVTPSKNLFHCLGCNAGGSVIDLVMKLENLDFRQAVDKLMTSTGLVHRGMSNSPEPTQPELPDEKARPLLERVITIYEKNCQDQEEGQSSPEGSAVAGGGYLEGRGIQNAGLIEKHRIGYCNGKLPEILPDGGSIRDELKALGVLSAAGKEHFTGCLVFPVFDVDGNITTLYGRYIHHGGQGDTEKKRHVFLPRRHTGLWNVVAIKTYSDIILVESVIDALSVEVAGCPNVISIQGTNGLTDDDIKLFESYGVRHITLLLDGDDAGMKAANRLKGKITTCTERINVTVKTLPDNLDPNGYLQKHGAGKLAQFLAVSTEAGTAETPLRAGDTQEAARSLSGGLSVTYGLRKYRIIGLEKGPRKLKATVRVEFSGKLHVDTLDFYSARSRRMLAQDLCKLFEETPETIEADITRLIRECESQQAQEHQSGTPEEGVPSISAAERKEAEAFGRSSNLIKRILADFEACGLVGEEPNKLLSYLAAISRHMEAPLAVLVLSSSGSGKTALQDCTLSFVPPEDLVKLTSLSGKALFYKERLSLKHKVLALEEGDGANEAAYAIRNLISARELVIESAIKDPASGKITTMVNRVEGPTAVFITTTDPETDPETKSRFFVTSIDESREQTRKILDFQRARQTLDGMSGGLEIDAILARHRNFQRLLKPLAVVNPFGQHLTYGDDRLQGRRDQPKYLTLIKAVAFLRQMQKKILTAARPGGTSLEYIEVDFDDIAIANKLAHEILGHSLDELSRPSRDLLTQLEEMVNKVAKHHTEEAREHAPQRSDLSFTRREIREHTGWSNSRVHRYLKELIELEYIIQDSGRNGSICRYRLVYEGQGKDGSKFMLGLLTIEELGKITNRKGKQ